MFYRQQLLQKLGLVAQGKVFSTGVEKFIEDSDLMITSSANENPSSKPVRNTHMYYAVHVNRFSTAHDTVQLLLYTYVCMWYSGELILLFTCMILCIVCTYVQCTVVHVLFHCVCEWAAAAAEW